MDIKLKKYSHSIVTKIIVFAVSVLCVAGMIRSLVEVEVVNDGYFTSVAENQYLESQAYVHENAKVIHDLAKLVGEYKNEEHIKQGGTISKEEWLGTEKGLFREYQIDAFDPKLTDKEAYAKFQEEDAANISLARQQLIERDLRKFHSVLQTLETYQEPIFYATNGTDVFTNTNIEKRDQFESYPAYLIFEGYQQHVYPKESADHSSFYRITEAINELDPENTVIYMAFSEKFIDQKTEEWLEGKAIATKNLYQIAGFLIGFVLSFFYLILVIGRRSFQDQELHFHAGDKIYNDVNIAMTIMLITIYIGFAEPLFEDIQKFIVPISLPIIALVTFLLLTLVKQIKNHTLFKHTLIFTGISKFIGFFREVYRSGSTGMKTVLLVIGYPILLLLTFFMFPITIGIAAWFAFKKVKSFQAIQKGVETIKDGNLHHRIEVNGKGEFGRLAANINSITDGLNKAVDSELKSERLKTELITNVSHDIRNPLTSIISYVDLLKREQDPAKIQDYVEVLDQKSKRLKTLTDDLFEAAKATSGNIPVQLEKIDIASLITQGLGEVSDKIEALDLDFKMNYPKDKIFLTADGKLLWRSIENLLSNIFKYTANGSRVYISIEEVGSECLITFKNISAYELNISSDELMERFTRGDESRSSQGSGLGLSIAKSLIEIQKGRFAIQIDGDLFKAMIWLPKHGSQ